MTNASTGGCSGAARGWVFAGFEDCWLPVSRLGIDLMVLQRRLGHESVTTTIDRYSHLMPSQHIEAARVAELAAQPASRRG